MTQPYLLMRHRSFGQVLPMAVFKSVDQQLIQIGTDFGASENYSRGAGGGIQSSSTNRVINWQNDLYAFGQQIIWKYDTAASGDWGVFYVPGSPNAQDSIAIGLVAASLDGEPILICGYGTGDSTGRFVTIDKDGVINESVNKTYNSTHWSAANEIFASFFSPISWRNTILFVGRRSPSIFIYSYDLASEILSGSTDVGTFGNSVSNITILNDTPYVLSNITGPTRRTFARIDGVFPTTIAVIKTHTTAVSSFDCIVPVTGCLYAAWYNRDGTPGGMEAHQCIFNPDGTVDQVVDVTSTLPTDLRLGGGGFVDNSLDVYARVDVVSNDGRPVATYEFEVSTSNAEGATRRLYSWDGDMNSQWSLVSAGVDVNLDYVCQSNGSVGERIWSGSGTLNASGPILTTVGTNIHAKFTVYGASQTGVKAEIIFDREGEITNSVGTLISADVGVINGNVLEQLTADGVTEITLVWAAAADGLAIGDNPKVAIRVFI